MNPPTRQNTRNRLKPLTKFDGMSLSDFALPSKYSNGHVLPETHAGQRNRHKYNEMNKLIHRIGRAKSKTISYLDTNDDQLEENDSLLALFSWDASRLMPSRSISSSGTLLHPRRPWTAPNGSVLKRRNPFQLSVSDIAEMDRFDLQCCHQQTMNNDENHPPLHNHETSTSIDQPSRVIVPEMKAVKWKRKSHASKINKQTRPSSANRAATPSLVEYQREDRYELLQRHNDRIEHAKQKRDEMYRMKMLKLEDHLDKKETRRLSTKQKEKEEHRQQIMIRTIIVASAMHRWLRQVPVAEFRRHRSLEDAATKIQTAWKKEMFARKAFEATKVNKLLHSCGLGWRIRLYARCSRRALYARVVRSFLSDMSKHPWTYVLFKFRSRILNAQTLMRSFIDCKRARLEALEESWVKLENNVMAMEEFKSKRCRRKNALRDMTYRKILPKGLVGVVKQATQSDRPASASECKEATPLDRYKYLCRFYLEDCRRLHIEKLSGTSTETPEIPKVTSKNDARKLLSGSNMLGNNHCKRMRPLFVLYCHQDELQKKIEGKRCLTAPPPLIMKTS